MPKQFHQLPCGLTIYQSLVRPFRDGETAVIGCPLQAFESITSHFDRQDVTRHMVALCADMKNFKLKIDYFPHERLHKIIPEPTATSEVKISHMDQFKEEEIKKELDRADSGLIPSAMVERPPAGLRADQYAVILGAMTPGCRIPKAGCSP